MRLTAITPDNTAVEIEEDDIVLDVDIDGSHLTIEWDDGYQMPPICHTIVTHPKKVLLVWTEDDVTRDVVIQSAEVTMKTLEAELLVTEVTEHV